MIPQELRVGNKIKDNLGRVLTVQTISGTYVACLYQGLTNTEEINIRRSSFSYDDVVGMPLGDAIGKRSLDPYGNFSCKNIIVQNYDSTQSRVWANGHYVGILHLEFFHELQTYSLILQGRNYPN